MPLPSNGVFSLQGHSKPGDTQYSKPKQAMIVRMSSETLDALESQPKMQFEFGDNPGIYIGDTFYPMKSVKETMPHELYLRTSSAAKPNMPLKLNALITGKFMVERELDPKVQDKVRDRTIQAEKQRTERKTIILDNAPPQLKGVKNGKKTKLATSRRAIPAESRRNISASVPARPPPPRAPSPSRPSLTERDPTIRIRIIHCLALKHRTAKEVARLVVGDTDDEERTIRELNTILEELAHPSHQLLTTGEQIYRWKLKPVMWKEVRPYEFPDLKVSERDHLCVEAARAFEALKIPPSDPCWNHIHPKSNSSSSAGPSTEPSSKPEPRKPIQSTKEAKIKKAKADAASKRSDTITAKDERARPLRVDTVKSREKPIDDTSGAGTPTSAKAVITRRLPGSGFRAKAGSLTPTPPAHDPARGGSLPPKRPPPAEVKMESSSSVPSTHAAALRSGHASSSTHASHALPKKPKDPQGTAAVPRLQETVREKERKPSPAQSNPTSTAGTKRRIKDEQGSEYSEKDSSTGSSMLKRRKIGDGQPLPRDRQKEIREREREYENEKNREREKSATNKGKDRDPSLPKKPDVSVSAMPPPRMMKIKREASPANGSLMMKKQALAGRSPLPLASSPPGRSPLPPPPTPHGHSRSPIPPNRSPMPSMRSPYVAQQSPAKPTHASERNGSVASTSQKRERERERERDRERDHESDRERGRDRERPTQHRANGSAKPRRKSPIYTSSEDESSHPSALDRIPSSMRRGGVSGAGSGNVKNGDDDMGRRSVTPATPSTGTTKNKTMISRKPLNVPQPLPFDPANLPQSRNGLQGIYSKKYDIYAAAFAKHAHAVTTAQAMLDVMESEEAESDSDLDPGVDLTDHEEVAALKYAVIKAQDDLEVLIDANDTLIKKKLQRRRDAAMLEGDS